MTDTQEPSRTAGFTTTRRIRVNRAQNSRGTNLEATVELTTDDPSLDLEAELKQMKAIADRVAGEEGVPF